MARPSSAEQSYPDPSGELEQQEAARAANDQSEKPAAGQPDKEPDLTRPGAIEDQMKNALEGKKGQENLQKLDQWASNPESFHGIGKVLSYFDTSLPMRKFRDWWEQRDHLTQWALMYGTTPPQTWMFNAGPIQALVKFGFIKYKGHYNENEEKMEAEIDKMGGMPNFLLKYGVKFGKYFIPELAGMEPFVEPLMKVQGMENKAIRNIRRSIRRHRANYERKLLQPADVIVSANVKTHGTLDHPENNFSGGRVITLGQPSGRPASAPRRPTRRNS